MCNSGNAVTRVKFDATDEIAPCLPPTFRFSDRRDGGSSVPRRPRGVSHRLLRDCRDPIHRRASSIRELDFLNLTQIYLRRSNVDQKRQQGSTTPDQLPTRSWAAFVARSRTLAPSSRSCQIHTRFVYFFGRRRTTHRRLAGVSTWRTVVSIGGEVGERGGYAGEGVETNGCQRESVAGQSCVVFTRPATNDTMIQEIQGELDTLRKLKTKATVRDTSNPNSISTHSASHSSPQSRRSHSISSYTSLRSPSLPRAFRIIGSRN